MSVPIKSKRTILHCISGAASRQQIINSATLKGISNSIPYGDTNINSVELTDDGKDKVKSDVYDSFINLYKNHKDVAIFYDNKHDLSGLNKFKSHIRKSNGINKTIEPLASKDLGLTANTVTNYGHTAKALSTYYNFPAQQGIAPTIGIISLGGTYLTTDLDYYWRTVQGQTTVPTVTYINVDGSTNQPNQQFFANDGTDENTLDIEILGGICQSAKIVVYFGPNTFLGFYDAINTAIHDTVNGPSIISISWGAPEVYYSIQQMAAYDQIFKTGINLGKTITVATGDNGSTDGITDNKPHVDFPSSSPHVVACGGTSLLKLPEAVWSWSKQYQWGTGGGISAYFVEPSYQKGIVKYLAKSKPSITSLNGHRALPDIALNADPLSGWTIYSNGNLYINQFGGTSCVAPAIAGLLGLMNLNYTNGFNTNLYTVYKGANKTKCFNDIVAGSNDNVNRSTGLLYNATTNYDCCTGLGTVNGANLYTYLLPLN
jgi:kumamolisin